ncbi:uncharacterized protein LOC111380258 [Olea europaea var. sylvestris]|uniref:uncharacterized protein LOC111380258 n=1 Tax=Olea europaea var. sylvestris TaxID=158386 RepID=UPI000C1D7180|nr:uncharacterized protein LOC111380258 [Olea europaea var. sylvestris]
MGALRSANLYLCTLLLIEGDGKTKNGASSRRQTTYGPQKEREVVSPTFSSTPLLKKKDKGKAITVPSYYQPPEKTEEYGNTIHGSCSLLEKEMDKVKGNLFPFSGYAEKAEVGKEIPNHSSFSFEKGVRKTVLSASGCSIEKTKQLRMGILNASNCSYDRRKERGVVNFSHSPSLDKTNKTGKTILNPSSSSIEKTKDKGKAVLNASSCSTEKTKGLILDPFSCSYEKRKERGLIRSPSSSSLEKTKEIGKTILNPSSSLVEKTNYKRTNVLNPFDCSIEKTEEKGKSILNPFGSLLEATKKKGKAILVTSSVEKLNDKRASATVLVNYTSWRRKSGKKTIDIGASSCPPLLKTKNGFDESRDVKPSKSWTDLHHKREKKRCIRQEGANDFCLPRDFIEKQRAYFEEVDKFELPVEEI